MDTSDWAASALFSPSKARVQQAQAKDWAAVEAWLLRKYPSRRVPPCERNDATLHALLALAQANDAADETRALRDRLDRNVLLSLSKKPTGLVAEVQGILAERLDSDAGLEALAETLVALDARDTDVLSLGGQLVRLVAEEFEGKQRLARVHAQRAALAREKDLLATTLAELQSEHFKDAEDSVAQTGEWTRSAKQLRAKIAEYDERLAAMRGRSGGAGIEVEQQKTQEVERQREALAELQGRLQGMQDLPPDPKAARAKIEEARDRLRALAAKRDGLFERMATV